MKRSVTRGEKIYWGLLSLIILGCVNLVVSTASILWTPQEPTAKREKYVVHKTAETATRVIPPFPQLGPEEVPDAGIPDAGEILFEKAEVKVRAIVYDVDHPWMSLAAIEFPRDSREDRLVSLADCDGTPDPCSLVEPPPFTSSGYRSSDKEHRVVAIGKTFIKVLDIDSGKYQIENLTDDADLPPDAGKPKVPAEFYGISWSQMRNSCLFY